MLAEDLAKFDLRDIAGGLDDLAQVPRRDGETAFPGFGTLKQAVTERKILRDTTERDRSILREAEEAKATWERERLEDIASGRVRTPAEIRLDELLKKAKESKR